MEITTEHKISAAQFQGELLIIQEGDKTYKWNVSDISQKLLKASLAERNDFRISTSGYGIHWPRLDEDLSLKGLLQVKQK